MGHVDRTDTRGRRVLVVARETAGYLEYRAPRVQVDTQANEEKEATTAIQAPAVIMESKERKENAATPG